jgi:hypothetical protein
MEQTFPAIKERADREGAAIFFADEAACRTDHHGGRSRAPVGQTPVVEHIEAREWIGMISAISHPIQGIDRKIFLIVGRARYHTSDETSGWLARMKDRIEPFFLPSYSPDLNPDEWVWKNVKRNNIYRVAPQESGQNCSQSQAKLPARSGKRPYQAARAINFVNGSVRVGRSKA